jgi:hypothetical protein
MDRCFLYASCGGMWDGFDNICFCSLDIKTKERSMNAGVKLVIVFLASQIGVLFGVWQERFMAGFCCWFMLMFALVLTDEIIKAIKSIK